MPGALKRGYRLAHEKHRGSLDAGNLGPFSGNALRSPAMPFTATDVLTAALVLITAYYAWQTRVLAQLTNETIEAAQLTEEVRSRPFVHVTGVKGIPRTSREPPDHFDLDLTIESRTWDTVRRSTSPGRSSMGKSRWCSRVVQRT